MKIIICTHHKTGTALMQHMFEAYSKNNNFKFGSDVPDKDINLYDIICYTHGNFNAKLYENIEVKGIHMIRNPYEIITSGYKHHKKCKEKWAVEYNKKLGMSYQQLLNTLNQDDGISEEIKRAKGYTYNMYHWNYKDDRFLNIKLEKFFTDSNKVLNNIENFLKLSKNTLLPFYKNRTWFKNHSTNFTNKLYLYPDFLKGCHYKLIHSLYPKDYFKVIGYNL